MDQCYLSGVDKGPLSSTFCENFYPNNNNYYLFKVQYPISSVDYNKRYTYIVIVIQYKFILYNAMLP